MKKLIGTVAAITLLATAGHVMAAGDAAKGKTKAMACIACHGTEGISPNDLWPNLAGQKAGYLVKQMKAFRDGQRTDPMMTGMAKPLSDQDMEDLAAYFSGL